MLSKALLKQAHHGGARVALARPPNFATGNKLASEGSFPIRQLAEPQAHFTLYRLFYFVKLFMGQLF